MEKTNQKTVEEIIRVDHAGERGAIKIYEGQHLALKTIKQDSDLQTIIEEMKQHEKEHLEYFEKEIQIRKIKPTYLKRDCLCKQQNYIMTRQYKNLGNTAWKNNIICINSVFFFESYRDVDDNEMYYTLRTFPAGLPGLQPVFRLLPSAVFYLKKMGEC